MIVDMFIHGAVGFGGLVMIIFRSKIEWDIIISCVIGKYDWMRYLKCLAKIKFS